MSIGLKRGLVKLEPHSKEWDESAREKIRLLRELLGEDARDIQHIGSTSIPAVLAKPIIDLVIGVDSYEKMHQHDEVLARHGILYRNQSDDGQLLYIIGIPGTEIRTHYIHVVIWKEQLWNNYVNFRDYLNVRPEIAQEYSSLKEKLAASCADDRAVYTNSKQHLIQDILDKAARWRAIESHQSRDISYIFGQEKFNCPSNG